MKKKIQFHHVFWMISGCVYATPSGVAHSQNFTPKMASATVRGAAHQPSNAAPAAKRTIRDPRTGDARAHVRTTRFLTELAVTLPALIDDADTLSDDQLYSRMSGASIQVYDDIAGSPALEVAMRDGEGWFGVSFVPLVPWTDSVAQAWQSADAFARIAWCLRGSSSFHSNFGRALLQLAELGEYLPAIERVADASMTFAARTRNVERADAFRSLGELLHGGVALARGDTLRALQAFRATFQWPRTPGVKSAVQSFALLAQKRSDPSDRFVAQTLLHLLRDHSVKAGGGGTLRRLYHDIVADGHAAPDLFPKRMRYDPAPSPTMSLDAYLDRQWSGLFDRKTVPTETITPSVRGERTAASPRLVVVEYLTGQGCSGCWVEDIGLQSLARRYSPDQVLTLAWHGHAPLTKTGGDLEWWARYANWYPRSYSTVSAQTKAGAQRIALQSLITAAGDTLDGSKARVNGHALPRHGETWTVSPDVNLYRRVVPVIERERARAPDAALHMDVDARHDSVSVRVTVDSIRGRHRTLVMRIALFADTVWKRGGNDRRIYTNVVQDAAYDDTLELGLPMPGRTPATIAYRFDLAEIQKDRLAERDESLTKDSTSLADMIYRVNFPDPRDWELDRNRLHVVAFVQDVETGDVLQAVRAKVFVTEPSKTAAAQLLW
jgi:hypothetical protein